MSREAFTKYTERGPQGCSLHELKAALQWGDNHPAEALAISRKHAAEERESDDREAVKAAFLMQGGSEQVFDKEWPKLRDEHNAAKLRELDQGAHAAALRQIQRSF